MQKVNLMDMDSTFGQMEVISRVISKMDFERVMECGKRVQEIVINMKVSMSMIKSMAKVYFLGQLAMSTKEIINKI